VSALERLLQPPPDPPGLGGFSTSARPLPGPPVEPGSLGAAHRGRVAVVQVEGLVQGVKLQEVGRPHARGGTGHALLRQWTAVLCRW